VRVLSAIILRQTLPQGDTVLFLKLSDQLQAGIKSELLLAILHEPERYVRSQISDTVASLASVLIYKNRWPELFPALYSMCAPLQPGQPVAPNADALKICALGILGKLSDAADNLLPQIPALFGVFQSTLVAQGNSLGVREAACVAACKIIPIIEAKPHTKEYQKLTPLMLASLGDALAAEDEEVAKHILSGFTEVATEEGKFFEPHLDKIVAAMYSIGADVGNKNYEEGLRQFAAEVLVGMAESAPTMVRKSNNFIKHSILVCMSLMLCVEEDPQWGVKQDSTDFYDNSNFDCGEMNMDRIAEVVKGTRLWPILKPILESFVADKSNWKMRHAGLFALAQTCAVISFEHLPVKEVCSFVRDPHPRVRYASVQCLGQFPVDFEVVTQTKWHKAIYPALMGPLMEFPFPRLQMHAASALLNMVDGSEPKILKNYLGPLMESLLNLLQNSVQMVQEQVMPVMAALAGQATVQFLPFYDRVVPMMKHLIAHANTKALRRLRAKAMESVTFIGMYCGKEKFYNDARDIMQMFMQIMHANAAQSSEQSKAQRRAAAAADKAAAADASEDDYSEQHMLQAWGRICTCLGEEFIPVLPYVMPQVFEAVTRQSEQEEAYNSRVHKLTGAGAEGEDGDDGEEEDANVTKDGRVKSISAASHNAASSADDDSRPSVLHYTSYAHTSAMEEKAMALSMLCSFCHDLQDGFLPYVKQSAEIMIPLLDHPHDEVQSHAIHGMPHLFRAAMAAHRKGTASMEFVKALLEAILAQLVAVFPQENNAQTLQTLVVALHDCVDDAADLSRSIIDQAALQTIAEALVRMLTDSHRRIEFREKRLKEEEADGELDEERIVEIEAMNVSEDGLNANVAACVEALIKSHGALFLPVADALFPELLRMFSPNSVASTRKIAVFIVSRPACA
jgi:hypothetical protein